jgi:hypothetical protein
MKISLPEGSLNSNRDPELTLSEILSKPTRALSPPLHGAPERPLSDTQAGFQAIVVRRLEVNSTVQTAGAASRTASKKLLNSRTTPGKASDPVVNEILGVPWKSDKKAAAAPLNVLCLRCSLETAES